MNKTVWLGRLLSIGGVVEASVGLACLVDPHALSSLLLRAPLGGPGATLARLGGGGLLALGWACWSARGTPATATSVGVAQAFVAYNVVAYVVLTLACPPLPGGLLALSAAILHGLLAAALVAVLLSPDQVDAEA
jgi:hypothetical protein